MKTYCEDYLLKTHSKKNISQNVSCCLLLLIERYNETNNNLSSEDFTYFLLNTLNYYLKDKNYKISQMNDLLLNNDESLSLQLFCKFIDILIHNSIIFLKNNQLDFSKFLLSVAVDIINKSEFISEKKIIKKKIALAIDISYLYMLNNNFIKSELFLKKCEEICENSLDKMILYNNYCILNIKKIKSFIEDKNMMNKIIDNILQYLYLLFNNINRSIENKNNSIDKDNISNHNSKNEIVCFLLYNCFKMLKIFMKKEFDKNYSNSVNFIRKVIGNNHFITLRMERIDNEINNSKNMKLLLKENNDEFDSDNNAINCEKKKNKNDFIIGKEVDIKIIKDSTINKNEENNENIIFNKKENIQILDVSNNSNNNNKNSKIIIDKAKQIEEKKNNPPLINSKKTWKGLFQTIRAKKFPGQENKLGELFKSISETKNKENTINSQYNEFHEEMESYLIEKKPDNYIILNKNYSNDIPKELIVCFIDENSEEKNNFDKINFEKSLQKELHTKHSSNFVINYFKNSIRKSIIFPELIKDILDYDILEKMNNIYNYKKKNELSINKEIERIINTDEIKIMEEKDNENNNFSFQQNNDSSLLSNKKIETEFFLDTEKYKIIFINDYENRKISIHVNKSKSSNKNNNEKANNKTPEFKTHIFYDDINYYYSKYYNKNDYEFCIYLRYMKDINVFIRRILVHYIRIIKSEEKLRLAFCKYPKSNFKKIYKKGRPEFYFLNEKCTFSLCKYRQKIEINIYNISYTSNLKIMLVLDYSSESIFFQENKKRKSSSKISADFEYNSNFKIFNKFSSLFIKLEKIFKFRDKGIKNFSEYAEKYKSIIHKVSCTESMINIALWIISLQNNENEIETENKNNKNNFYWNIEFYSLTKLAIKTGSYYISKNIILTPVDFENILGCDYDDIHTIIDDKDNYFCLNFLLGTVQKMKHILIKMLNSSNYLTAFRLQKINPVSFFKYKFVFKHIKRYFICSLEFLIYSRETFFLRIILMETMSNRCYSKIYIPFYSIKFEFDFKEMEKFLRQKYSVINSLYENKQYLKKFLMEESQNLLTKSSSENIANLVLFENIEFLVEKIKKFLAENNS